MGEGAVSSICDYIDKIGTDQIKVICRKCRRSTDPKKMSNSNMVSHLKAKHKNLFGKYKKKEEKNNKSREKL